MKILMLIISLFAVQAFAQSCPEPTNGFQNILDELNSGHTCGDAINTLLRNLGEDQIAFEDKDRPWKTITERTFSNNTEFRLNYGYRSGETFNPYANQDQSKNLTPGEDLFYTDLSISFPRPADNGRLSTTNISLRLFKVGEGDNKKCLIYPDQIHIDSKLWSPGAQSGQDYDALAQTGGSPHLCERNLYSNHELRVRTIYDWQGNSRSVDEDRMNDRDHVYGNTDNALTAICRTLNEHNRSIYQSYGARSWEEFQTAFNTNSNFELDSNFRWDNEVSEINQNFEMLNSKLAELNTMKREQERLARLARQRHESRNKLRRGLSSIRTPDVADLDLRNPDNNSTALGKAIAYEQRARKIDEVIQVYRGLILKHTNLVLLGKALENNYHGGNSIQNSINLMNQHIKTLNGTNYRSDLNRAHAELQNLNLSSPPPQVHNISEWEFDNEDAQERIQAYEFMVARLSDNGCGEIQLDSAYHDRSPGKDVDPTSTATNTSNATEQQTAIGVGGSGNN